MYRQKVNKHTFPIHAASRMRREVVWDIFEQNTSNHFSVHVGSVKCEALWIFSLIHISTVFLQSTTLFPYKKVYIIYNRNVWIAKLEFIF